MLGNLIGHPPRDIARCHLLLLDHTARGPVIAVVYAVPVTAGSAKAPATGREFSVTSSRLLG